MNVRVEKLTKRFTLKGTAAVFEASFEAAPGGITTLLGPSGSGKTTILRIIAGLESADEGRVFVGDKDITTVPVGQRNFGFVFQTFALFEHLTVRENVGFALEAQGLRGDRVKARVDELLEMVQLQGLGARYPLQLSGGQRQRVGFARALAAYPKVLLLDEPFGALDARVRVELRAWLRDLHAATHLTTLLVTHDQEEALELSDRVVVMDHGLIQQVGTPREVYEQPATPFVASFVGTANVIRAEVKGGRASIGTLRLPVPAGTPDGSNVHAIVRPHDVRVAKAGGAAGSQRIVAHLERIARLGAHVKLALVLPTGETVTVHMPRGRFDELHLAIGDDVMVDLENARIFVEQVAV